MGRYLRYKIFLLLLINFLFIYFMFFNYLSSNAIRKLLFQQITFGQVEIVNENKSNVKTILFWMNMFSSPSFEYGFGSDIFKNCSVPNCFATNDKNYKPIDEFDAIMFHGYEYRKEKHGIPEKRSFKQVYIFLNMEPAIYNSDILKPFKNFYNWTVTFLSDSDVQRTYGFFEKKKMNYTVPSVNQIQRRSRKVAWFVSRCGAASKRDDLAKRLSKYINVDIYGHCGNFTCTRKNEEQCYELLQTEYKFYLSSENSYCKDYVTEKLFKVLNKNVIPIVYGDGDYEKIAPPHSVIDVRDFKHVSYLADYLKKLDSDPEEYLKYFHWKLDYYVQRGTQKSLCDLCAKLNEPIQHKVYEDIDEWFRKDRCKMNEDLPKIIYND